MGIEYKGYYIESDGAFGLKRVKSKGTGALPKDLRGSWTKVEFVQKAIDVYSEVKEKEVVEKKGVTRG